MAIETRYLAFRSYTHSDRKQLLKVLSRPAKSRDDAQGCIDMEKRSLEKKKSRRRNRYEYFVGEFLYDTETGNFQ